ncbi:hypothetical protein [Desulfococcus sp.]|uniref:hypothetical protein n=1 Tax=Desulfococcus sp. TaxID=2025834 RepID=UPI003593A768
MEQIPCCHCGDFFTPSPRHKAQVYCLKPPCRRARKAAWKRNKIQTDPDYRYNHKLANQKWAKANPGYWKDYRSGHPEYVERNRLLQTVRNRRRRRSQHPNAKDGLIAKVDASIFNKNRLLGQFYLVPVIANVDALKVNIFDISNPYR